MPEGIYTHGKMILLGEHAVVHGSQALAAPVGLGLHAVPDSSGHLTIPGLGYEKVFGDPDCERLGALLRQYMPLDRLPDGFGVRIEGDLPSGCGLGYSATLSWALAQTVAMALAIPKAEARVWANAMEDHFHGGASGVDLAAVLAEGPIVFRKGEEPRYFAPGAPLYFAGVVFPVLASTRQMVADFTALLQDPVYAGRLRSMSQTVHEGLQACQQGDVSALGQAMDCLQEHLQAFGMSNPTLDAAVDAARAAGALGAKLSGAGGGGLVLALARDASHAQQLQQAMLTDHVLAAFTQQL